MNHEKTNLDNNKQEILNMKRIVLAILVITVFLVIESHSRYRRKDRKRQHSPGFRRRVVNDEDWENVRPGVG
jgi:hypothetical protein